MYFESVLLFHKKCLKSSGPNWHHLKVYLSKYILPMSPTTALLPLSHSASNMFFLITSSLIKYRNDSRLRQNQEIKYQQWKSAALQKNVYFNYINCPQDLLQLSWKKYFSVVIYNEYQIKAHEYPTKTPPIYFPVNGLCLLNICLLKSGWIHLESDSILHVLWFNESTVRPVLRDCPWCHQEVVSQKRQSSIGGILNINK